VWPQQVPQLAKMPVNPWGLNEAGVFDCPHAGRARLVEVAEMKVCAGQPERMEGA